MKYIKANESKIPSVWYHGRTGADSFESFSDKNGYVFLSSSKKVAENFSKVAEYVLVCDEDRIALEEDDARQIVDTIDPFLKVEDVLEWGNIMEAFDDYDDDDISTKEDFSEIVEYYAGNRSDSVRLERLGTDVFVVTVDMGKTKIQDYEGKTWGVSGAKLDKDASEAFAQGFDTFIGRNIREGGVLYEEDFPIADTLVVNDPYRLTVKKTIKASNRRITAVKYDTVIYKSFVDFVKEKLGITTKVQIQKVPESDKYFGDITLREDGNYSSFKLRISKTSGISYNLVALGHEMTHAKQIETGELELINGSVYWLGDEYISQKEYENIEYEEHSKLPWEIEATKMSRELTIDFKKSTQYSDLSNSKDANVKFIIDNDLITASLNPRKKVAIADTSYNNSGSVDVYSEYFYEVAKQTLESNLTETEYDALFPEDGESFEIHKHQFPSEHEMEDVIYDMLQDLEDLGDPITVYRAVTNIKNLDNMKSFLKNNENWESWSSSEDIKHIFGRKEDDSWLLEGEVDAKDVDWELAIDRRISFPEEKEVPIKNPENVKIKKITNLGTNEDIQIPQHLIRAFLKGKESASLNSQYRFEVEAKNYPSLFEIGEEVKFSTSIDSQLMYGEVSAVRFTKAKVFYDILDDYTGEIFDEVDSNNVFHIGFGVNASGSDTVAEALKFLLSMPIIEENATVEESLAYYKSSITPEGRRVYDSIKILFLDKEAGLLMAQQPIRDALIKLKDAVYDHLDRKAIEASKQVLAYKKNIKPEVYYYLYHGTNKNFDSFDTSKAKTVRNDKLGMGDGIYLTKSKDVAEKYADAQANQYFDKDIINELKQIDPEAGEFLEFYCSRPFGEGWDDDRIKKSRILDDRGVDVNRLVDIAEYVEGSKVNEGQDDNDGFVDIFGGVSTLPGYIIEEAQKLGIKKNLPRRSIIHVVVAPETVIETDEIETAKNSDADMIIFTGSGTVDNEPEYVIKNPNIIRKTQREDLGMVAYAKQKGNANQNEEYIEAIDSGEVIPLSEGFDSSKQDIRAGLPKYSPEQIEKINQFSLGFNLIITNSSSVIK